MPAVSEKNARELIELCMGEVLPKATLSDLLDAEHDLYDAKGLLKIDNNIAFPVYIKVKQNPSSAALKLAAARLSQVIQQVDGFPLLISTALSESKQELLRGVPMNFMDEAGNAWIEAEGLFVDRRGFKQKKPSKASNHHDIFSDKATLLLRLLFGGERMGVREISAQLTDQGFSLSPGYVSKLVKALVEERYAEFDNGKVRLINRELLLRDWTASYRRRARRARASGWFLPAARAADLVTPVGQALEGIGVLTERAGASLVDPYATFESVDILVRSRMQAEEALREMGASEVERGSNINVIEPCYTHSAFFGARAIEGVPVASDIQLYLDLSCQQRRGQEAAEHLYERSIRPLLIQEDEERGEG